MCFRMKLFLRTRVALHLQPSSIRRRRVHIRQALFSPPNGGDLCFSTRETVINRIFARTRRRYGAAYIAGIKLVSEISVSREEKERRIAAGSNFPRKTDEMIYPGMIAGDEPPGKFAIRSKRRREEEIEGAGGLRQRG